MNRPEANRSSGKVRRSEFYRPVRVDKIGDAYRETIRADDGECAELARRFSLRAIERLRADVCIVPKGRDLFVLTGEISARVVQSCVVTGEPVPEEVHCSFSVSYSLDVEAYWENEVVSETDTGGTCEDPPEPIENGEIDMGESVAEQLILEITPYPRVHGASLVDIADGSSVGRHGKSAKHGGVDGGGIDRAGRQNPFAVLEKLKLNTDKKT